MNDERRYTEDEIRRIFDEAAQAQDRAQAQRRPGGEGGMTLAELERIGAEVGIEPAFVEQAARSLEVRRESGRRRLLGLPIGVRRSVSLDRRLTDAEWEVLVAHVRTTFDAQGRLGGTGSFRQWVNGNLQVLLEPEGDRHRLRMRTMRGQSRALMSVGGMLVGVVALVGVLAVLGGGGVAFSELTPGLVGLVLFTVGAGALPGWAAEREAQMEDIAERALLMAAEAPSGDG